MAVDICYMISHGFTTRMLMQTGLIEKLLQKGLSIAIISPDANDENLNAFVTNPNVRLVQWKEKSSLWDDDYLHKRMYFLEDIRSNTALMEKVYNGLFYSNSKHPWKRIRPLYYYLVYLLIPYFRGIRKRFLRNEERHLHSDEASNLIKELEPKLTVSTYPVSIMEAKILFAAKQKNLTTVEHLLSWDNIGCKGKFPVLADSFIAWGDIMMEELKETYQVSDDHISICGVPHFDKHVEVREEEQRPSLEQFNLDPETPYLFFAMSSPRFAPREIEIVAWLAKAVEENRFSDKMQLVVRPHPQNVTSFTAKQSWLKRLDALQTDRVAIDYPMLSESNIRWSMKQADMENLSRLICGCSICFNSGSTVSIDGLMHNKPVIITAFDGSKKLSYWNSARRLIDYAHLAKYIEEGGAIPVHSYDELVQVAQAYLDEPNHDLAKRRSALFRECYHDDGKATERVVERLTKLVKLAEG